MPIPKLFWTFSFPAIIGMLVQALYNIVDRIFINRIEGIGAIAVGGVGVALPIMFVFLGFSMLFGIGGATNISIKLGEKRHDLAEKVMTNSLFMLFVTSLILCIAVLWDTKGLLTLFGATPENVEYGVSYLRIIAIGNLWNTFAFAFTHLMRSEGNPTRSMVAMFIGAGTNLILDPIFIFTFKMGVQGAAYATIISQFFSLVWSLSYYLSGKSHLKIKLRGFKLDWKIIRMVMAIGLSPFIMQIGSSVVGAVFNNSLKLYGTALSQSAYITINSITMLFFMPIFGMNQGLQPIVGYNYGAKRFDRVLEAYKTGVLWATVVVTVGWILTRTIPTLLIHIVATDPLLVEESRVALMISESVMFIVGFQIISTAFFQSIGKAKIGFLLSLVRTVIVLAPLLVILPKFFGINGIWLSIPVADVIAGLIVLYFITKELKRLKRNEQLMKETE
ncbi:MATE family efflux transporter [Guggenheimella bovis]